MTYELLVRSPALDDVAFRTMVSLHVTIHTRIPPDDGLTHIHPHHHLPIRLVPANLDPLRIVLDCTSFADASMSIEHHLPIIVSFVVDLGASAARSPIRGKIKEI